MFRPLLRALAALGVLASVSAARAGTFNYSSYSVLNNQNVFLDLQQPSALPSVREWAGSGEILLYSTDVPGGVLPTWCIDIPDTLLWSGQFTTGKVLTGTFGTVVNALLTNVLPQLLGDNNASSALQVAIWKAEYGNALTVTGPTAVTSLADKYLQNVSSGSFRADPGMQVSVLSGGGRNQDQAYLTAVPEPRSVAMLGAGLIGVGLARRRINRKA